MISILERIAGAGAGTPHRGQTCRACLARQNLHRHDPLEPELLRSHSCHIAAAIPLPVRPILLLSNHCVTSVIYGMGREG